MLTEGLCTLTVMEAGSFHEETKSPLVFTWLTGEVQKRSLPIGRAARCSRRSSVSQRQRGHPSEHSSSPFIWFYLRPQAQPLMIGVHKPSSSPDRGEGGFLADGLFSKGTHFFLSLYCPVLSWLWLTFL